MQLIDIPFTHQAMTVSASLSGITILTQSSYKARHPLSKELVQIPMQGITLKKYDYAEIERKKSIKKRKKKKDITLAQKKESTNIIKSYVINKKEVSHRIRNFINQMAGEKQLYFWTITFPLNTTDDTAFILMNKWLTRLRKEKMLKSYLWVTERQQNGTIHFHMAVNHRMDIKKSNRYMRACIFTSIDNKEINFSREAAKNYNGVDISKDRKTKRVTNFAKRKKEKSLSNYLTKYITKNDGNFSHLAWHSSRDYSNLVIAVRLTEDEWEVSEYKTQIQLEKPLKSEWYTFYRWKLGPPKKLLQYLAFVNQTITTISQN